MVVIEKIVDVETHDDETLKHLQSVQLEMLKDFIAMCSENNLNYVIHSGTALGAVRHGGFIPWDDEIDVVMFREDYEKFIRLFKNGNDKYFLSNWYTSLDVDEKYLSPKSLLCLKNTDLSYDLTKLGIYIDVSVIDNIPQGKYKTKLLMKVVNRIYYFMHILLILKSDIYRSRNKERFGHFLKFSSDLFHIDANFFAKLFTKMIKRYYKKTGYVFDMSAVYEASFLQEYFEKTTKIKFEDILVNIPTEYDKILKGYYGNYMELPPVEERRSHCCGKVDFGDY